MSSKCLTWKYWSLPWYSISSYLKWLSFPHHHPHHHLQPVIQLLVYLLAPWVTVWTLCLIKQFDQVILQTLFQLMLPYFLSLHIFDSCCCLPEIIKTFIDLLLSHQLVFFTLLAKGQHIIGSHFLLQFDICELMHHLLCCWVVVGV